MWMKLDTPKLNGSPPPFLYPLSPNPPPDFPLLPGRGRRHLLPRGQARLRQDGERGPGGQGGVQAVQVRGVPVHCHQAEGF